MTGTFGKNSRIYRRTLTVLILIVILNMILIAEPAQATESKRSNLWLNASTAEFYGWQGTGTTLRDEALWLNPAALRTGNDPYGAGSYAGGNYYNGGSYSYGDALSPYYSPAGAFDNAVVSWNAVTPAGTWVELRLKALIGARWTREYVMGVWSSDRGTVRSHSVNGQADGDGKVETDTLILKNRATAFQIRAVLFTTNPANSPALKLAAVSTITNAVAGPLESDRAAWGTELAVPERSQMIYPDGGEVWCSPTSTSMALAYWSVRQNRPDLNFPVPQAAAATLDWIYDGNGNWPFNTAWVGSQSGLTGYVTRLSSLSQVESWISRGVPVIVSIAYSPGQLAGTPIPQSSGHLLVVRGFDRAGNVITNDPAADPRRGQSVRIVYNRSQFETRWQASSSGAAYIVYPQGWAIPTARQNGMWASAQAERLKNFADPAIERIWQAADRSVTTGTARSWIWGPGPLSPARLEPYIEGPGGQRLVQYFDKSRMEITRPQGDPAASWYVTNGLLTVELVTGSQQLGDFWYRAGTPANIPVAGDPNSPLAPTYATFRALASVEGKQADRRAPNRSGQGVTATLGRNGEGGQRSADGLKYAYYEPTLGHNLPDVFWSWMNDPARSGLANGWLFALGYPISEPYWVQVNLGGQPATVLVQLFERRALTYAPNNPAGFKIEMGNIGQHYLAWRSS